MLQPRDGPTKQGRFSQLKFTHAFGVTLVLCVILYVGLMSDIRMKRSQPSLENWKLTGYIKNAVSKLQSHNKHTKPTREKKLILIWTNFFTNREWLPPIADLNCPVAECDATYDHSLLNRSSAVVLHWRNTNTSDLPDCDPSKSAQCPHWVLFNKESPPHTSKDVLEAIQDKVRWIVTYRKDSDIPSPYGQVVPKSVRSNSETNYDPNRRLLCWLVSNCETPSRREVFVAELKNYIEVDTYGKCSEMRCPYEKVEDCYVWLSNRCLFYLSLENSMCRDYTTEKLYYALATNMVPVVMGDDSNYRDLPPRSYINVNNFSSPKELAEYLVSLGRDKSRYLSYFWWKRDYEVKDSAYLWVCDLCAKVHNSTIDAVKTHTDLVSWWFDQSQCTAWRNL